MQVRGRSLSSPVRLGHASSAALALPLGVSSLSLDFRVWVSYTSSMARSPSLQTLKILMYMAGNPGSDHYGTEIGKATRLPAGTLYPLLGDLEDKGWVESDWERVDPAVVKRGRRRYYRLTATGSETAERYLEEEVKPLARLRGLHI